MQFFGKATTIYSTLFGLMGIAALVLLGLFTECRQESALTACAIRWGNYGLSIQWGEQPAVWLLGVSDIRLWPARWAIPLALKWAMGIITFSIVGILVTLSIAWLEHLLKIVGKKTVQ